jgi:hypothetical protein
MDDLTSRRERDSTGRVVKNDDIEKLDDMDAG